MPWSCLKSQITACFFLHNVNVSNFRKVKCYVYSILFRVMLSQDIRKITYVMCAWRIFECFYPFRFAMLISREIFYQFSLPQRGNDLPQANDFRIINRKKDFYQIFRILWNLLWNKINFCDIYLIRFLFYIFFRLKTNSESHKGKYLFQYAIKNI